MTKMIKMSLVAAVSVAGISSTAFAGPLKDAIENTSLSGHVRWRHTTNHETGNGSDATQNSARASLVFKTKVNTNVTATTELRARYFEATSSSITGSIEAIDSNGRDSTVKVNQANFTIQTGAGTLIAGLQPTQTPFVEGGGVTVSNGFTALVPAGPVTLAGAYYTSTINAIVNDEATHDNVIGNDIAAVGAIGKFGPVNLQGWYADVAAADFEAGAIIASGKAGPATVYFHHGELDDGTPDDITNTLLTVAGKVGAVNLKVGYAVTGDDSGDVTLTNDDDGGLIYATKNYLITTQIGDVSAFIAEASVPVGKYTFGLNLLEGEAGDADLSDVSVSATYAMSKNFKLTAWYDVAEIDAPGTTDDEERDRSRFEAKYTF